MATVTIRPNSDEYKADLTLSSGTLAYALIDEATLDTGDYVTCDAYVGGQLTVGWTDTGLSSETINKVTFYLISSQTGTKDVGHRTAKSFQSWGSATHAGEGVWSIEFTTNPLTTNAWTVSELDALICGFFCEDAENKNDTPVYQFYAVVDYTAGGSDPSSIINHIMHYRRLMSR